MKSFIIKTDKEFMEFAKSLGTPVSSRKNGSLIDMLRPLNTHEAHPQSLSAKYGFGSFPFHTDGAYFKIPPRYMVMRYVEGIEYPTPTVICDLGGISSECRKKLSFDLWKVKSKSGTFFTTIFNEDLGFFRFDEEVMQPLDVNMNASSVLSEILNQIPKTVIDWEINKTVVIDNWKVLHSRPTVKENEINRRTIQRILVL